MSVAYMPLILVTIFYTCQLSAATEESDVSDNGWDLKAEVSLGAVHDSNVSIKEIDSQLRQSDSSRMLGIGITARRNLGKTEISGSYRFNRSKYQTFSEVNRETKIYGLDITSQFFGTRQGISFHKADAMLGKKQFLKLERFSPYISGFLTKRLFLRGAFVDQEKTIAPRPNQSAKLESATFDAYYFRKGLRNYFNIGGIIRNENAVLERYDNRSKAIRLRMFGRVRAAERVWRYTVSWSYEKRKYEGIWPRSENERFDRRRTIQLNLLWPISESITGEVYADLTDTNSSVSYASFEEDVVGFKITYKWD